jgi:hypothetical protein
VQINSKLLFIRNEPQTLQNPVLARLDACHDHASSEPLKQVPLVCPLAQLELDHGHVSAPVLLNYKTRFQWRQSLELTSLRNKVFSAVRLVTFKHSLL